jgi:hypothetical protein
MWRIEVLLRCGSIAPATPPPKRRFGKWAGSQTGVTRTGNAPLVRVPLTPRRNDPLGHARGDKQRKTPRPSWRGSMDTVKSLSPS